MKMKKNLFRMLALGFCCGLCTTMLTACGGDDEEKKKDDDKASIDVSVALVTQADTYKMFTFDFVITDANGKTQTMKLDATDNSTDKFTEAEASNFQNAISSEVMMANLSGKGAEFARFVENYRMHHFTFKNVPANGKITFKTIAHKVSTYEPLEKGNAYMMPTVMVSQTLLNVTQTLKSFDTPRYNSVDKSIWEKYVATFDGKEISEATGTVEVKDYRTN